MPCPLVCRHLTLRQVTDELAGDGADEAARAAILAANPRFPALTQVDPPAGRMGTLCASQHPAHRHLPRLSLRCALVGHT